MTSVAPKQLSWCFSTLGCPELSLEQSLSLADRYHFSGIEIRALEGRLDIPELLSERYETPEGFGQVIARSGVDVVCLNSSLRMTEPKGREEFLRYATWANSAGIPALRAFDGGQDCKRIGQEHLDAICDTLNWWDSVKSQYGFTTELWIETHWSLCTPESCLDLIQQAPQNIRFIWDVFHTWRQSGRDVIETWNILKPYVAHIHFKDAVLDASSPKGARHCPLGEGSLPLMPLFEKLASDNFQGSVSLEWERYWNPNVAPLEQMLERGHTLNFW